MSKLPKFLFCNNIMASERIFILHTQKPVLLVEIFEFDNESDWMEFQKHIPIGARTQVDDKYYVLEHIWEEDDNDPRFTQEYCDKIAKIMSRMGDWWHAYVKITPPHPLP